MAALRSDRDSDSESETRETEVENMRGNALTRQCLCLDLASIRILRLSTAV